MKLPDLRIGLPVAITSMDKDGRTFLTRIVEAAEDSINIVTGAEMRIGCLLTMETDSDWIMTRVSECEAAGDGYRVVLGVLESVSKRDLNKLRDAIYNPQPETIPSFAAA